MARRVADFIQHVTCTGIVKTLTSKCSCFSIGLDESIDVTNISQLMIFSRLVERFLILKNAAMKLFLMFQSTYICESALSAINTIKTKNQNRLGNKTLGCKIAFGWPQLTFPSIQTQF